MRRLRRRADARVDDQRNVRKMRAHGAQGEKIVQSASRADRRAPGHQHLAAGVEQLFGDHQVVGCIGKDVKAFIAEDRAASTSPNTSGASRSSSPITSSLIQLVENNSRAICAVATASFTVRQPAVFGRTRRFRPDQTPRNSPRPGRRPPPGAATR